MPNISAKAKKVRNNFQATKFFLTIPHFDEIEKVYSLLLQYKEGILNPRDLDFFKNQQKIVKKRSGTGEYVKHITDPADKFSFHSLKDFAVVCETHTADPKKAKHLHIFIEFDKSREISQNHFDFLGKHGNLQRVRSSIAVLEYMQKESEVQSTFDIIDRLMSECKSNEEIRKLIFHLLVHKGWQPADITVKFGSKILGTDFRNLISLAEQAKADFETNREFEWMKSNRIRTITREIIEKRLTPTELGLYDSFPIYQELIDVVNRILVKGNNHDHKSCTISLVGKPSIGKSTFVNALAKHFTTYKFPLDNWHTQYVNGIYEMWVWHEWDFRIISLSDFLLLTEGEQCDLKVKFAKTKKKDRPLLWLLSNKTFAKQAESKFSRRKDLRDESIEALQVRIQEFDFGSLPLHFLTKLLVSVNEDI